MKLEIYQAIQGQNII